MCQLQEYHSSPLRQGYSLAWSSLSRLRLTGQETGVVLSPHSEYWEYKNTSPYLAFSHGSWGPNANPHVYKQVL